MIEKNRWLLIGLGIVLAGAIYLLGVTQGTYQRLNASNYATVFKTEFSGRQLGNADLGLLWDVIRKIDEKYIGMPNYRDMAYGAIKGAVAGLGDPYTVFTDPTENKEFFNALDGVYEGIGVEVDIVQGQLVVISPLAGSPAEEAGLRPNDVITAVDGKSIIGLTMADVLSKIKGPSGTSVKLSIVRGEGDPFVVTVSRQVIKRASVDTTIDADGIATIRIFRFSGDTEEGMNKAVDLILEKKARGVVLDLRGNPGGFLDAGVMVANEFLKEGRIVEERFKTGEITPFDSNGRGRLKDIPLVVLLNSGSASASEIVAGALQDHKRATIVGVKSYGKGSVQEVESFPDGSALRVTVAKWFTPAGRSISENGIEPDRVVELDDKSAEDNQLATAKAILKQ